MPEDLEKFISRLFLLLPGFLSMILARYVSDMGEMSEFELTFYSFILTLVNLAIIYPGYKLAVWIWHRWQPQAVVSSPASRLSGAFVLCVLLVSIVVGITVGTAYESDMVLKWLRSAPGARLLGTRSYQRPLTFLLGQNRKGSLEEGRPQPMKTTEAWVEVHLTSGKIFSGYPEFFSSSNEPGEIFLSPACKHVKKSGKFETVVVPGPGVFVFERDIGFLEFVDRPKSECHNLWKSLAQRGG